jgi:hypothetical protein
VHKWCTSGNRTEMSSHFVKVFITFSHFYSLSSRKGSLTFVIKAGLGAQFDLHCSTGSYFSNLKT